MAIQSGDPAKRARAIVQAVTHYNNPKILAEVSHIVLSPPHFIFTLLCRFRKTWVKPWLA
jgi:hypothetical protein